MRHLFTPLLILLFCSGVRTQDLIPYLDGNQYGYANVEGEVVIAPQFDEVNFFNQKGIATVKKGDGWSLINRQGILLMPFSTNWSSELKQVFNSNGPIPIMTTYQGGALKNIYAAYDHYPAFRLINIITGISSELITPYQGKLVVQSGIERAISFHHGLMVGRISDSLYQVVDTSLNVLIESRSRPIIHNDSLITAPDEEQTLLYNCKTQKRKLLPYLEIEKIIDGKYCINSNVRSGTLLHSNNGKYYKKSILTDLEGNSIFTRPYEDLNYYRGSILIATSGDTTYLLDFNGNPVSREIYKSIDPEAGPYYKAKLFTDQYVLLDSTGHRALKNVYDFIGYWGHQQFYNVRSKGKTSLLNEQLKLVVHHQGEHIYKTDDPDSYIFGLHYAEGLMNGKGDDLIPAQYDLCYPLGNPNFIQVSKNGKKGILRRDGRVLLDTLYDDIDYNFNDGHGLFKASYNNRLSCYDEWGNLLGDSLASSFFATAYEGLTIIYIDSIYYVSDSTGRRICPPVISLKTERIETDSTIILILKTGEGIYVARPDGSWIVPPGMTMKRERKASLPEKGWFGVERNGKEGVINHYGKWIIPLSKHQINFIKPQFISIQKGKYTYLYHSDGSRIHHKPFDSVTFQYETPLYEVTRNYKIGYIDHTGQEIIPAQFDEQFLYDGNVAKMILGTEDGHKTTMLFDTLGKLMLSTPYNDLYPLNEPYGFYEASLNGLKGIIDLKGNIILPLNYPRIQGFADTTFFTWSDKDCILHLLNRKGQLLYQSPDFPKDHIQLPNHRYVFLFNDHSLIVDHEGKVIKRIESNDIETIFEPDYSIRYLRVQQNGLTYYINTNSLAIYKKD